MRRNINNAYAYAANSMRRKALCFRVIGPAVRCPSVSHTTTVYIYLRYVGFSVKPGTTVHHVSEHCWKGFQGQRSKVKVMARSKAHFQHRDTHRFTVVRSLSVRRRYTFRWCVVEAHLFLKNKSTLRWVVLTVLWIGFCHTGHFSLCVDLFVFTSAYFCVFLFYTA